MENSILTQQEELLSKWKNEKKYESIVKDGILDQREYLNSEPKIAFLLKEGNDNFQNIAPLPTGSEGYGPDGSSKLFWRFISGWSYIIGKTWKNEIVDYDEVIKAKENPVNQIAYINVKKKLDNQNISSYNDIYNYAVSDRELLLEQIELTNPDVIYCGGTINFLKVIYNREFNEVSPKVLRIDNRMVIDYLHPAHRNGYKAFYDLADVLKTAEVKKEIEDIKKYV